MYVSGDELHMKFSTWRALKSHCYRLHSALSRWQMCEAYKKKLSIMCWKTCTRMQYSINLMANTEFQVWMYCQKGQGAVKPSKHSDFHHSLPNKNNIFSFTRSLLGSILTSWTVDRIYCSYGQLHNSGLSLQSTKNRRLHSKKHTSACMATAPAGLFSFIFQPYIISWFLLLCFQHTPNPQHTTFHRSSLNKHKTFTKGEKTRTSKP